VLRQRPLPSPSSRNRPAPVARHHRRVHPPTPTLHHFFFRKRWGGPADHARNPRKENTISKSENEDGRTYEIKILRSECCDASIENTNPSRERNEQSVTNKSETRTSSERQESSRGPRKGVRGPRPRDGRNADAGAKNRGAATTVAEHPHPHPHTPTHSTVTYRSGCAVCERAVDFCPKLCCRLLLLHHAPIVVHSSRNKPRASGWAVSERKKKEKNTRERVGRNTTRHKMNIHGKETNQLHSARDSQALLDRRVTVTKW
jgi:hypothetical protein